MVSTWWMMTLCRPRMNERALWLLNTGCWETAAFFASARAMCLFQALNMWWLHVVDLTFPAVDGKTPHDDTLTSEINTHDGLLYPKDRTWPAVSSVCRDMFDLDLYMCREDGLNGLYSVNHHSLLWVWIMSICWPPVTFRPDRWGQGHLKDARMTLNRRSIFSRLVDSRKVRGHPAISWPVLAKPTKVRYEWQQPLVGF